MPPSIAFTKETILQTAFDLSTQTGIANLTARKIAGALGCSVVPIYTNFRSLEELKSQVMEKALEILLQYTKRDYSSNLFLNIGLGILAFARDYRLLYRAMFLDSNEYTSLIDDLFRENLLQMKKEESLKELNEQELAGILEKTRLFTHGLAAFLCSGNLKDQSDEYIHRLMKEAGEDIFGYTLYKKRNGKGSV